MATIGGLLMPDMYGAVQEGYKDGQGQLAQRTLQQYAKAAIGGDQSALAKIYGVDPGAGMKLQQFGRQQKQQAQQDQDAGMAQVGKYARMITTLAATGDMQGAANLYKTIYPQAAQVLGGNLPQQFDPSMLPHMKQLADAMDPQQKSNLINVGAGGAVFDPTTGKPVYTNPGVAPKPQLVQTDKGYVWATPGQDSVQPLTSGGQPQNQPSVQLTPNPNAQSIAADQATALLSSGVDQGRAAAMAMAAHPGTTLAFDAASGRFKDVSDGSAKFPQDQPQDPAQAATAAPQGAPQADPSGGMGTPSAPPPIAAQGQPVLPPQKSVGQVSTLSPAEVKQLGLPDGTVAQRDPSGKISIVSKGINVQGDSTAPVFGDGTKSGAEYIQTIPSDEQAVVKGVLNGTKELPKGSALKSPYWQSVMASVMHADPSWNEGSFKQYADTRKYFTTGKGGVVINNISTAMQHASELMDAINDLDNGSSRALSAAKNDTLSFFGGQGKTNFEAILTPLASELASVYKNGNAPTDQETQEWREKMTANMSKAQQMNVLRRWIDLLAGKMNAVRNQYHSSMSDMAEPLTVVNPDAREAMARISKLADKLSEKPNPETKGIGTAPIYAPGQAGPRDSTPPADHDPLGILQ